MGIAKKLYGKYDIKKANGQPTDPKAKYFVLRLDTDPAARAAMLTYANEVEPEFAAQIRRWVGECGRKSVEEIRKIYDCLVARFGKSGIDDILYPCWDPDLVNYYVETPTLKHQYGTDTPAKKEYPYQDFVYNLEWFLDVLRERGKWPLAETIQTEGPCNERRGEIDE